MLSNVVDDPGYSTVIFPSIVDRSPIQIAISSGGDAPVLVRLIRTQLEALFPAGMSKLAALAEVLEKGKGVFIAQTQSILGRSLWRPHSHKPIATILRKQSAARTETRDH